ncbi:hypothetical protein [Reyranella sp.]|uniref:hypothetical protein n=1 Tax=Reyranella sp. TaxID=1929291 RepID=UPI003BAABD7D
MPPPALQRLVVLLLWSLSAWSAFNSRALFWDGSAFLANILELGQVHDFYTARAHVDWVTQAPVLALAQLGVRDTWLLSMVYSATLFGLPTALYHLALARVRDDGLLLAIVVAVVATVYLPTSFFIVGEYNVAFAAATAAVATSLRPSGRPLGDALLALILGLLCVRSYEAMVYLGPLVAAILLWSARGAAPPVRLLLTIAALAFAAAAIVAGVTIVDYWDHPHFVKVRSMTLDFWQNLQFAIPVVGLVLCGLGALLRPAWLQGSGPLVVVGIAAAALALTPWYRLLHEHSILYPPSHYLARQAAGGLLAVLLGSLWIAVAWRDRPPRLLAVLRLPTVSRRAALAMTMLLVAAAVPDLVLTGLWSDYLGRMRALVDTREGAIRAADLPLLDWPDKLFAQDWSLPAMSALVSRTPGRAYVLVDKDYRSNPPFDPACGTLPRLEAYGWKK